VFRSSDAGPMDDRSPCKGKVAISGMFPDKDSDSLDCFKGILHPKMKILSSFTRPQVVANPYEFLSSAEHKGRYFEERLELNSCLAPLTSIVEKKTYTNLKML